MGLKTSRNTAAVDAPDATDAVVWRLPEGAAFERSDWGDEVVVFNRGSGQTHLLDALSDRVLRAFQERSWSLPSLARALGAELNVADSAMRDRLTTVISEFTRLGLLDADDA